MRYTSEAIGEPMLAQHLGLVAQLRQWLTNATAGKPTSGTLHVNVAMTAPPPAVAVHQRLVKPPVDVRRPTKG